MRKTKIICTIGPSSMSEEKLREMMLAGMNVTRFNFSHADHAEQGMKFDRVRKVSEELGLFVATLLDTKGPEVRLGDFENGEAMLEENQLFTLTTEEIQGTKDRATISYKELTKDIKTGMTILIDDGKIGMTIEKIEGTEVICRVNNGGKISNHKGINVPGATLSMPFISQKDHDDIVFGAQIGVDYIAASFTRSKEDVLAVRKILVDNGSKAKIIAKIENTQGIQNMDEILEAADGIMVARGDLGVEVPFEDVPVFQKELIKKCVLAGKIVVTATQMLESMITNPRPTRAEVTDVANAIYDGTTAIMLSGESAAGKYPVEAIQTMVRIAERTEKDIDYVSRMSKIDKGVKPDVTTAISHATCTTAMDLNAEAIITVSMSGFTTEMVSRYKPNCTIVGCSVDPRVCRQMNLAWGVQPLLIDKAETEEELFTKATSEAKKAGYIKTGDTVVLTAGVPLGVSGKTNMIRVIEA